MTLKRNTDSNRKYATETTTYTMLKRQQYFNIDDTCHMIRISETITYCNMLPYTEAYRLVYVSFRGFLSGFDKMKYHSSTEIEGMNCQHSVRTSFLLPKFTCFRIKERTFKKNRTQCIAVVSRLFPSQFNFYCT